MTQYVCICELKKKEEKEEMQTLGGEMTQTWYAHE
jgi:hypothetical protein